MDLPDEIAAPGVGQTGLVEFVLSPSRRRRGELGALEVGQLIKSERKVDPDFGMQAIRMRDGPPTPARAGAVVVRRSTVPGALPVNLVRSPSKTQSSDEPSCASNAIYIAAARREEIKRSRTGRRPRGRGQAAAFSC